MHYQTIQEKKNRTIKQMVFGVSGILIITFIGIKLYPIIHGPSIHVATINNGQSLVNPMIQISGKAKFTKDLFVNGAPLATAPDGSFNQNLLLNPGYNLLTLEGKDRFGSISKKDFALVLEESNSTLTMLPISDAATY